MTFTAFAPRAPSFIFEWILYIFLSLKPNRMALGEDEHLRNGLNVCEGRITHRAVADALKLKFTPAEAALRL